MDSDTADDGYGNGDGDIYGDADQHADTDAHQDANCYQLTNPDADEYGYAAANGDGDQRPGFVPPVLSDGLHSTTAAGFKLRRHSLSELYCSAA